MKLYFGLHVVGRIAHEVNDNLLILGSFFLYLDIYTIFMRMCFSTHNTFQFLVQFGVLCPKPWHLKHCWI